MEQMIADILKKMYPDVSIDDNTRLVDDGILDSLDIVTLVTELNAAFDIVVPAVEIVPDHFNSVAALAAMVRRLDDV